MLWKDTYKTGIDEIDGQNFDLIKNVEAIMSPADNGTRLNQFEIFEELVIKCFEREQRLHEECRYYYSYWHGIAHAAYIKALQRAKQDFFGTVAALVNERVFRIKVFEFLKNHITCLDKSFARFYHKYISLENFFEDGKNYATTKNMSVWSSSIWQ